MDLGGCISWISRKRRNIFEKSIFQYEFRTFIMVFVIYPQSKAKVLIERWRIYYNTIRPHSSLDYMPPAPEAKVVDISLPMA